MNNKEAVVENINGKYTLTIPSYKNWFFILFTTIWLFGWLIGLISAIVMLVFDFGTTNNEFNEFITTWLIGWIIAGLVVSSILLWAYFGKEKLQFNRQIIHFEKTVFGIGIKKKLNRKKATNFRFEKANTELGKFLIGNIGFQALGWGSGKIKFDYDFKTYSFGLALIDGDAIDLVTELNKQKENI